LCNDAAMRRRLILLFAFAACVLGVSALAPPAHAAAGLGKTGVYDDGCGNKQVWVNGQNLGPYYLICMPPETD
jgi:hypothetical protein